MGEFTSCTHELTYQINVLVLQVVLESCYNKVSIISIIFISTFQIKNKNELLRGVQLVLIETRNVRAT
jgi:hypothetical protein